MNKIAISLCAILFAAGAASCSTKDVEQPDNTVNPDKLYEIADEALGEYLVYNSSLAASEANALPYGTAIKEEGKYYINKDVAATAQVVYLVKNGTQVEKLKAAGLATAETKIASLDGIQFFTGAKELKLTSNEVTGALDLSMLAKLETLEMNSNFVNSLKVPASVKRLRYSASKAATAPENRWLTAIDLSACVNADHIYLIDHKITAAGLSLPATYTELKELDLSGNPDAPFIIPDALFDQLTDAKGVMKDPGETGEDDLYKLTDTAFAEYLLFNSGDYTAQPAAANKLPAGIVVKKDDEFFLNKKIAATVTPLVYLVKNDTQVGKLEEAKVTTAVTKIVNLDGIQFFTSATELKLTSNEIAGALDLSMLTSLTLVEMNFNLVNSLAVPVSLEKLNYNALSTATADQKLAAVDFSACTNLDRVRLENHNISTLGAEGLVLPADYSKLTELLLKGNPGADFIVADELFDQLTVAKSGVIKDPGEPGGDYDGPEPEADYFQIPDLAFAEYILYNCVVETSNSRKLPAGTAVKHTNGKIYIHKATAATATVLYVNKATSAVGRLENDAKTPPDGTGSGSITTSASVKIADMDGLQFFTNLTTLNGTSNELSAEGQPKLAGLTKLKELSFGMAGINALNLSAMADLETLDIRGSTKASLGKLQALDLSANTKLKSVNLKDNWIAPANFTLPSTYVSLTYMNMGNNKIGGTGDAVTFAVPALLFNGLTDDTADNKAGLVSE